MSDKIIETSIKLPTRRELTQEKYPAPEMACRLHDHAHELLKQRKPLPATIAMRRAIALAPDHPIMLSTLGAALFESGHYSEAETALRQSVSIEPDYAPSCSGLGSVIAAQNRIEEAKAHYQHAISIDPDYGDAIWNYSMILLDHGQWAEAWPHYQKRFDRAGPRVYPQFPYPTWRGEDLTGKTLLIHGEQGVGDRILFSRYIDWVHKKYPTARLMCMMEAADLPDIANLMWAYRGIVEFAPKGVQWPRDVDYAIFMLGLVELHGSTPENVYPDPGLFRKLAEGCKKSVSIPTFNGTELKIGINWTGSPSMARNGERSIPPGLMATLAGSPNIACYSLQFGSQDLQRIGADQLICDLTNDIGPLGFVGTAAVMQHLDLVITNCTSVAHLAGATDVPCWTLLCANPYWIWGRSGDRTPWYPQMRLFRQTSMNDWAPVLAQVKSELFVLADNHVASRNKQAA